MCFFKEWYLCYSRANPPLSTARLMNTHEQNRLFALRQLNLLDTSPSEGFDRITRMASQLFDLPIAAVSLTDENRQWFKSRVGSSIGKYPGYGSVRGCLQYFATTYYSGSALLSHLPQ